MRGFHEVHEVRKNEEIKSVNERELEKLRRELIDLRIGSDRWMELATEIHILEAQL